MVSAIVNFWFVLKPKHSIRGFVNGTGDRIMIEPQSICPNIHSPAGKLASPGLYTVDTSTTLWKFCLKFKEIWYMDKRGYLIVWYMYVLLHKNVTSLLRYTFTAPLCILFLVFCHHFFHGAKLNDKTFFAFNGVIVLWKHFHGIFRGKQTQLSDAFAAVRFKASNLGIPSSAPLYVWQKVVLSCCCFFYYYYLFSYFLMLDAHRTTRWSCGAVLFQEKCLSPGPGPLLVEFACSPCICAGSLRVPSTVQNHACGVKL